MFKLVTYEIPNNPIRFKSYITQVKGVSEETTKQFASKNELLFPAISVNDSFNLSKFEN